MADGDAAAAAGLSIVSGGADRRDGYKEINKTRDYLADVLTRLGRLGRREAAGSFTTSTLGSTATQTVTITYPAGRFSVAPALFVEPGEGRVTVTIVSNSATGATVILGNFTSAAVAAARTGYWRAVQMTETTAAG